MRKAVIDLGSNSFHLLVADLDGTTITPVLRKRAMLHLGQLIAANGALPESVLRQVVDTTSSFVAAALKLNADPIRIVATAAIRDATNRDVVVEAIAERTGVPVSVLTPEAEGKFAFHGVCSREVGFDRERTVIDLGGGSLEIITGVQAADAAVWSVPVGTSRLMRHVTTDPLHANEREAIVRAVHAQLAGISPVLAPDVTIIGGSIRALAKLLAATKAPLTHEALADLTDTLASLPKKKRQAVKGMRQRRVDHIHVAGVILSTVLHAYGIERFTVSGSGLREGVLLAPQRRAVQSLKPKFRRQVDANSVGERVSIRHLLADDTHGTTPTDVVGRLAAFDDDVALVIDRHGALHIVDPAMILASRVIPAHPTRPPEPLVGTQADPVDREAARAVIIRDDRVLLVAHHPEPGRTVWTAPGGGSDGNETVADTVRREMREELGIDVTVGDLLFERCAEFAFRGVWLRQHETWVQAALEGPFQLADAPLIDASTSTVRAFTLDELVRERDVIEPPDLAEQIAHLFTSGSRQGDGP